MKLIILILFSVLLFGCSHTENISPDKIDEALTQKILKNEKNKSDDKIEFIGVCTKEIDDQLKEDIESTDVEINSVSNDIFTGRGTSTSVLRLSGKDFILFLQSPRKLKPNEN
jgi:hypothetical protein